MRPRAASIATAESEEVDIILGGLQDQPPNWHSAGIYLFNGPGPFGNGKLGSRLGGLVEMEIYIFISTKSIYLTKVNCCEWDTIGCGP